LLEITNLCVSYGNIEALHGISLEVGRGEIVALLGANGAGKSTTLLSIMRVSPPDGPRATSGRIRCNGRDLLSTPPHHVVSKHRIALVPEGRRIFGNLTVFENLKLATFVRKDKDGIEKDYNRVFSLFPVLRDRKKQKADTLSGGEQQMLAMGRAFMSGARFILLDEPSMGLSPLLMTELFRVLEQLNRDGLTLLIVEQNAHMALKYAHRAYLMEAGRIVKSGIASDLTADPAVQKAYLG
jgi:branched-chain amino acid transport system ATP-binding protein